MSCENYQIDLLPLSEAVCFTAKICYAKIYIEACACPPGGGVRKGGENIVVEAPEQIFDKVRMNEHIIDNEAMHEYLHELWFRVLREGPQGQVMELCRQANLSNAEIQNVAHFRTALKQQHRQLEELQEAIRESERRLSSPAIARANQIAATQVEERRPSMMRRLGRLFGRLIS